MSNDPLSEVMLERARQDQKWGEQNHPDLYWLAVLTEEVGELAKELIEGRLAEARRELVQVTAVGVAWLEAMERRASGRDPGCPCDDWDQGVPNGSCFSDGHYRCPECRNMKLTAAEDEVSS